MKILIIGLLTIMSSTVFSAEIEINRSVYNDRETKEGVFHTTGEYVDQEGNVVTERKVSLSSIHNDNQKYISTQYALIPATSEVRNILKQSRSIEVVEGSILETKVTDRGNIKFNLVKILVRSVL